MSRIPSATPPVIAPIPSVWDQKGGEQPSPSTSTGADGLGQDRAPEPGPSAGHQTAEQGMTVRNKKVLVDFSDAEKTRLQNNVRFTMGYEGHTSQVEFIRAAIDKYCTDLEARHNNGEPWPSPGKTR